MPEANRTSSVPVETPTPAPIPQAGMGSIAGSILLNGQWEDQSVYVYAAPFYGDDPATGMIMLDAETGDYAELTQSGEFFLPDLLPGKYILAVGPSPEQSQQVSAANGELLIIEISAGEVQALGQLQMMQ